MAPQHATAADETKPCPFCGEAIRFTAIKCRFCGEMLNGLRPGDQVIDVARPAKPNVRSGSDPRDARPSGTRPSSLRTVIGLAVLGGLAFVIFTVWTGLSLRTAVSGPEIVADETYTLDEGQGRTYSFSLGTRRRIHVSLRAQPKRVNVLLMTDSQYAEYTRARGKLLGGEYHYLPELSANGVMQTEREALLSAGHYTVVVERPNDSLLITDKTTAHVTIKGM